MSDAVTKKAWEAIARHRLFEAKDTVVVAVSGGADSTALAHVLAQDAGGLRLRLHLAHFNHGWRGEESDRDEAAARALAERLTLPISVSRARARGGSASRSEEKAREARYAFLKKVAAAVGARRVAAAHTADDQVETVLMNLLRGTGPQGLAGMPFLRDGWLARPLLNVWRTEIETYCAANGLSWVRDSSNADLRFTRNWARLRLLPLIEERFGKGAKGNMLRAAGLMGDFGEALQLWQSEWLRQFCSRDGARLALEVKGLSGLPEGVRLSLLRACVREVSAGARDVGLVHLSALNALCEGTAGTKETHLPHGLRARREYGILIIERVKDSKSAPRREWGPEQVGVPGRTDVPAAAVCLRAWVESGKKTRFSNREGAGRETLVLDASAVRLPLWVRCWRPGDRMEPRGMRGSKKLQDLFVDERIPAAERGRVPVVVDDSGRVVWVVGLRVARGVVAGAKTEQRIVLTAEPAQAAEEAVRSGR